MIHIPAFVRLRAVHYLETHNLGKRSFGNGNYEQQKIGIIAEWTVYRKLFGRYPEYKSGFDGGYDMIYKGRFIDIKTRIRKRFTRPSDWNSFFCCQLKYKADTVIFCSYNTEESVLEICGWLNKDEITKVGKFWAAGSKRSLPDGSVITLRLDEYQIMNSQLRHIKELD